MEARNWFCHLYFAQVQGQIAEGEQPCCDFVVYTTQGLSIQRDLLDSDYWNNLLLPKLVSLYNNCVILEIVSPIHMDHHCVICLNNKVQQ